MPNLVYCSLRQKQQSFIESELMNVSFIKDINIQKQENKKQVIQIGNKTTFYVRSHLLDLKCLMSCYVIALTSKAICHYSEDQSQPSRRPIFSQIS